MAAASSPVVHSNRILSDVSSSTDGCKVQGYGKRVYKTQGSSREQGEGTGRRWKYGCRRKCLSHRRKRLGERSATDDGTRGLGPSNTMRGKRADSGIVD